MGENHEAALAIRAQEEAALMASVEAEAAADMEILAAVRRRNCSPQSVDKLAVVLCMFCPGVCDDELSGRSRRLRTRSLQRRRHQLPLRWPCAPVSKARRRSAAVERMLAEAEAEVTALKAGNASWTRGRRGCCRRHRAAPAGPSGTHPLHSEPEERVVKSGVLLSPMSWTWRR